MSLHSCLFHLCLWEVRAKSTGQLDFRFDSSKGGSFAWEELRFALDRSVSSGKVLSMLLAFPLVREKPEIDELYLTAHEALGVLSARLGYFSLPFSLHSQSPFNSSPWTISRSSLDSYFDSLRFFGFDLQKRREIPGHHFSWSFGLGPGTGDASFQSQSFLPSREALLPADLPREGDFALYGHIGKEASNSCDSGRLAWHFSFLWDEGSQRGRRDKMALFDALFERPLWGVMLQGMLGVSDSPGQGSRDGKLSFAMAWFDLSDDFRAALRYDHWNLEYDYGGVIDRGHSWTACMSFEERSGDLLQLEWRSVKGSKGADSLLGPPWQLRYLLRF